MKNTIERRTWEVRAEVDPEKRVIQGVASVFNQLSEDLGGFREIIKPGAFREAILESDIKLLVNHTENLILARKKPGKKGTLEVWESERGLEYKGQLGSQTYASDYLETIQRGDIDQASFGFIASPQDVTWERVDGIPIRTVHKVTRLFDVSPVVYPAYSQTMAQAQTEVATRQLEKYLAQEVLAGAIPLNVLKLRYLITSQG